MRQRGIITINPGLPGGSREELCSGCPGSCQSACKTSLTVSNQPCARERR